MLNFLSSPLSRRAVVAFLACALTRPLLAVESPAGPNSPPLQESFQLKQMELDQQFADALIDRKDWTNLDAAVVNLQLRRKSLTGQQKWTSHDESSYIALMSFICGRLASIQVDRKQASQLMFKYATEMLREPEKLAAADEAGFVLMTFQSFRHEYTLKQTDPRDPEEWTKYKEQQTERWLHATDRLEAAIDKKFDVMNPDNWPSLSVPVPKGSGVGFVAGVSPEAIADPALREQYKAAIKKNSEKSKRLQDQIRLKNLYQIFFPNLIGLLTMAYSATPEDAYVVEVKQHIKDPELANQIIDNVKARIGKANTGGVKANSGQWAVE